MANTYTFIQDSIEFKYEDGGIALPQKITTINNSRYALVDALDIDWNNAYLTYLGQIEDDFFTEYKHTDFADKKVPKVNADGYHDTRYDNDEDYKDKSTDEKHDLEPQLPLWRSTYTINSTPQLLDLVNYMVSRMIYADKKILELDNLVNLTKLYVTFHDSTKSPIVTFTPELNAINNVTFTLKPCLGLETETKEDKERKFNIYNIKTMPMAKAPIFLNTNIVLLNPSGLGDYVLTSSVTEQTSGDITTTGEFCYDFDFYVHGFDKNFKAAQYNVQFTSRRVEGKYDFIDPLAFIVDVNKAENSFDSIIINDIEYLYFDRENNKDTFAALEDLAPEKYFLIEKAFISDDQYTINEEGKTVVTFNDPGNDDENPQEKSLRWYITNGKLIGTTKSGAVINYIPIYNSAHTRNIVKIYPAFLEGYHTVTETNEETGETIEKTYSLSKDIYDDNDTITVVNGETKMGVTSYIELKEKTNISIKSDKISYGVKKWDSRKQRYYYEYSFTTSKLNQNDKNLGTLDLKLMLTGTKYVALNDNLYNVGIPCATSNFVNVIWKINGENLNSLNTKLVSKKTNQLSDKDLTVSYEVVDQIVGNNGVNNIRKISLTVPVYSFDSFTGDDAIESFSSVPTGTKFNLFKALESSQLYKDFVSKNGDPENYGTKPFIEVFPEGFENINLNEQIVFDKEATYEIYLNNNDLKNRYINDKNVVDADSLLDKYFVADNSKNYLIPNKLPNSGFVQLDGKTFAKYLQVKGITKRKDKQVSSPIFTVDTDESNLDYFYLPLVFKLPAGSFNLTGNDDDDITYTESLLYIDLRIIRGSNKLVGFSKLYNENADGSKTNEIINVKLFDEILLNASDSNTLVLPLYRPKNKTFKDNNKISHYMTARNMVQNDKKEYETLDFYSLDNFEKFVISRDNQNLAFTEYFVTNYDEEKYLFDSNTFIRIENMFLRQDNSWNGLEYNYNTNFFFDFDVKRLNRFADLPDIIKLENQEKFINRFGLENFNAISKNNINLNQNNIGITDNVVSAPIIKDNSVVSQNIIMFFGKNTQTVTINLPHIIENLIADQQNQEKLIVAGMICPTELPSGSIDYWTTGLGMLGDYILEDFNTNSPYKDFVKVNNSLENSTVSISIQNIQTLIEKETKQDGKKGYKYPIMHNDVLTINNNTIEIETLHIVLVVWVPFNNLCQGTLFKFNLKLILDEHYDCEKLGSRGLLGTHFFTNDKIDEKLRAITETNLPIYLLHFIDKDGTGVIEQSEINYWTQQ